MILGGAMAFYSIFAETLTFLYIGFGLMLLSAIITIPSEIKKHKEERLKVRTDYNDIIDLIKENKLKDAFNKNDKDMVNELNLRLYLQGVIMGKALKGDDLDDLKLKLNTLIKK